MNLLTQCMDGTLNSTSANTTTAEDFIMRTSFNTQVEGGSIYNSTHASTNLTTAPPVYLPSIDHYSIAPNGGLVHKNGPFKCDKCPAVFMLEVFFQLHKKKHCESDKHSTKMLPPTKKSGKKKKSRKTATVEYVSGLVCRRCRVTAPTFEELLRHMSQHSSSKEPSQCGNCDYVTMNRGNFKRHIMTHGNIRPFKCHMCPFSASQKTHLNKHLNYHCGNREFQCDLCSYNCSDKANFNRHKNLHPTAGCTTPTTMIKTDRITANTSGASSSQDCGQCTTSMAQLSGSKQSNRVLAANQTATTLTDHMNQVVAMTTADVAMAADIAMTTRDVMTRQLDITRLFKNVGQDLNQDAGNLDPMVSMVAAPRNCT